jgi:ribosome-binding protein aMBF1 (putative translation factor)
MPKRSRAEADIAAEFGERVRQLRKERGLSQERLAC